LLTTPPQTQGKKTKQKKGQREANLELWVVSAMKEFNKARNNASFDDLLDWRVALWRKERKKEKKKNRGCEFQIFENKKSFGDKLIELKKMNSLTN
jgi:hypothetical protein